MKQWYISAKFNDNDYYLHADTIKPNRSVLSTSFIWVKPNIEPTYFEDPDLAVKWFVFLNRTLTNMQAITLHRREKI